ncbi:WhiB family transcriptional regulator [Nonomuraea sp. NPDC050536]|uniref:WhiB family transcriptional regulator n=1 Tax=Nonomuraea sp. NPDC050536 TaxID=3364366 RepID=UPI0037C634EF
MLIDLLTDLQDAATENAWMADGLCGQTDPEAFFPPVGAGPGWADAAKQICRTCLARERCLAYALDAGEEWGVWGGLTGPERGVLAQGGLAA